MARQNHGPLSRAKGKLGGVVYQQYEGMQIAREYQPVVKNPQSTKQTENRAKFKLASQLVAQFADVLNARLAKLSIYTRKRRAASVNAVYGVVSTDTPSTPQALIADVLAAINAKSMQDFEMPTFGTPTAGTINLTATDGDTVIVTNVGYGENGEFFEKLTETYTSDGTAKQFTVIEEASILMAVALRPTTEAGRASIGNLIGGTISAGNVGWTVDITRAVANGDLLISGLAGAYMSAE